MYGSVSPRLHVGERKYQYENRFADGRRGRWINKTAPPESGSGGEWMNSEEKDRFAVRRQERSI